MNRTCRFAMGVKVAAAVTMLSGATAAELAQDNLSKIVDAHATPVTINNFIRAATDIELDKYVALAGGINKFFHFRKPTPIDVQPTVRMNRDTLYSSVVVDISKGATLTLPDAGDRYMATMVVDQDHYVDAVFHGGGTYELDMDTFGTPYVIVLMRTLVDANDPADVAIVNALQDQMKIDAASATPFVMPNYDEASYEGVVRAAMELGRFATSSAGVFGTRDSVNPVMHFIGTAVGWGGLPEQEAYYLSVEPNLPVGEYKIDVPADVPVGAFWSISLYNATGFFEPNAVDGYVVNSVMGKRNDDGSTTVHLGGCEDGRVNCLPIMEDWNYTVRLYQPSPEILDGSWAFPSARPMR